MSYGKENVCADRLAEEAPEWMIVLLQLQTGDLVRVHRIGDLSRADDLDSNPVMALRDVLICRRLSGFVLGHLPGAFFNVPERQE
jgi:hypothetical protein